MIGKAQTKKQMNDQTIYQFEVEDITGKAFPLSSLQGKKVMIVNTASKCGLTPQYKELEALYQQYKDKDFVIIGFPANNFLYWLVVHLLIGTACSALFPYLMVCFSLKTSSPEKTAQLSGLAQTGGYILAAFGPTLFGYSFELFQSWIPAVLALLAIDIIMTISLFMVDRTDKIL